MLLPCSLLAVDESTAPRAGRAARRRPYLFFHLYVVLRRACATLFGQRLRALRRLCTARWQHSNGKNCTPRALACCAKADGISAWVICHRGMAIAAYNFSSVGAYVHSSSAKVLHCMPHAA